MSAGNAFTFTCLCRYSRCFTAGSKLSALYHYQEMAHRLGGAVGAAQARAAQTRREATSRLGLLQMPVLVLWGEEDALAPVSMGRTLAEDLPHAQFHVIKDCGHLPTLEQRGEAAAILGKFLRDKHPRAE